ncbi:transketolase [Nibricoccus sp. IMCC34717]|uniref:transketolase n=1 Tax=Nibricoccus sp. IMCC34717 TaxID=3034021 RepID=UPI00384FC480
MSTAALQSSASLDRISRETRLKLIEMSHRAQSAHLGGALSCVDLLVALYWTKLRIDPTAPLDPERDRLVFSKGHAVSALYAVLARRGFFPESALLHYNEEGSHLPEQPSPGCAPGVEWATGSLGHGLGVGIGMALSAKIQKQNFNTYVVMSDGECQEGSVWEAAMLAPRLKLNNLCVLVDFNKWQATGRSNEVMSMESLRDKWASFGWHALELNGHDLDALVAALSLHPHADKPYAIIAHTTKGKGASFIEDDNNWHYRSPTAAEVEAARKELGLP